LFAGVFPKNGDSSFGGEGPFIGGGRGDATLPPCKA
jgi:hypothetical protein